jgi:chitin disaccharide deacetylase
MFRALPEGLTFLSLHFNAPGDFEAVEPERAYIRTDEFALFQRSRVKEWVGDCGIEVIGMRALREDLRARWTQ